MTISELRGLLEELEEEHGDCEVRLAVQPTWPLNHSIDNVRFVEGDGDPSGTMSSNPDAVWIAASHSAPYGERPYAPKEAWDEE
jgi:hypothetical protein